MEPPVSKTETLTLVPVLNTIRGSIVKLVNWFLSIKYFYLKKSVFYGNFLLCKDSNACAVNPCLNGATCQITGIGTTYICTCTNAYSGTNCQNCTFKFFFFYSTMDIKILSIFRQCLLQQSMHKWRHLSTIVIWLYM